ncbi:hypothetical protein ACFFWC_06930, partial [Plantactinospora siamensis]
ARRAGHAPLGWYAAALGWLALAGVAAAVVVLLLPGASGGAPPGPLPAPVDCLSDRHGTGCPGSLPGFDGLLVGLASAQVLLLIAIGGVSRTGRRALAGPAAGAAALLAAVAWLGGVLPAAPPAPGRLPAWTVLLGVFAGTAAGTLLLPRRPPASPGAGRYDRMAWGGCAPAVLAGLGWLLASSYSAGALYWTMARLNRGHPVAPVLLPVPVAWAGPAFLIALLALAGTGLRAWVEFLLLRRRILVDLVTTGPPLSAHERRRARDVAAFHALHRLVGDRALRLVGQLTAFAGVLAAVATAGALAGVRPVALSPAGWAMLVRAAVDGGASLAGLLPVLVSCVGLLVYRKDSVRRAVGVIWDIGTFWPRAAHPLAPPSYAERAVPQLQTRVTGLMALPDADPRHVDGVVLSGHSQGAVISAAVILQVPARWRRRLWFFSYGCQLSKLYGRVFPAYFGPDRLPAVTAALTPPGGRPGWTNFWRPTDPLGWPVPAAEREFALRDPVALHPRDGEVRDPPIRSHGGYPLDPEYRRERAEVARLLAARLLPAGTPRPDGVVPPSAGALPRQKETAEPAADR